MMNINEKYLLILNEFIRETRMEKLAEDPKMINSAYQMLLKFGALSELALMRKFKITATAARKIIQRFKDEEIMDKFNKLVEHRVDAN